MTDNLTKPDDSNILSSGPSRDGCSGPEPLPELADGGGSSILLDPIETTGTLQLPSSYRALVAQNDDDEMEATAEIYMLLDGSWCTKKSNAFAYCRTSSWFIVNSESREVRVATRTCKLRWCPMCAKARMRHLTSEVTSWFENVKNPKFLTLTVQHNEEPLHDQIEYLYDCFKNFRKRKLVKDKIDGGVWFFQIHKSKTDGLWHCHLHCVIDSGFIPQKKLSDLWLKCTLTSCVVDIRAVKRPEIIAEYVARYAARPSILGELEPEDRIDLVRALQGRRLVGAWGTARKIRLRPALPDDTDKWKSVGGWSLIREYLHESDEARAIVNAWRKKEPLPPEIHIEKITERGINLPWIKKSLEHEPFQLTFFDTWANPPPIDGSDHE